MVPGKAIWEIPAEGSFFVLPPQQRDKNRLYMEALPPDVDKRQAV